MGKRVAINKQVAITAMYFRNKHGLTSFPRRMEFNGNTYMFRDGLLMVVKKGQDVMRIFTMTDGNSDYRLMCDAGQNSWTLVEMTE